MTTVHMYAQGIVQEQQVEDNKADELVSRATRSGYTAWKIQDTSFASDLYTNRRDR
jgi:hypothetical protein